MYGGIFGFHGASLATGVSWGVSDGLYLRFIIDKRPALTSVQDNIDHFNEEYFTGMGIAISSDGESSTEETTDNPLTVSAENGSIDGTLEYTFRKIWHESHIYNLLRIINSILNTNNDNAYVITDAVQTSLTAYTEYITFDTFSVGTLPTDTFTINFEISTAMTSALGALETADNIKSILAYHIKRYTGHDVLDSTDSMYYQSDDSWINFGYSEGTPGSCSITFEGMTTLPTTKNVFVQQCIHCLTSQSIYNPYHFIIDVAGNL